MTAVPILAARNVRKEFSAGLLPGRGRSGRVVALDGVDIAIGAGERVGLVGESGSGKSTLAEVLLRLEKPSAGVIESNGRNVWHLHSKALTAFRRDVQMVFQDPYATLNPRFTVRRTLAESLAAHGVRDRQRTRELSELALERAELWPAHAFLDALPSELSGGQRQRVAIARAIVLEPKVIVADEPVSMLDVSVRSGILSLFERLGEELSLAVLFISHDLSTVRQICQRVAVMHHGRIVEQGPVEQVLSEPRDPYTRALLGAVPPLEPGVWRAESLPVIGAAAEP